MYADDLVLLGENENDLQSLLDVLYKWCDNWNVQVNCEKSAVIHFRPHSKTQTTHSFTCGNNDINVLNSYKYLGLVLTDSLNSELTVKSVAQSANRALGLLICKVKTNGGVPYECFVKLFDRLVWPIISYGASIWGTRSFPAIEAVFNRACRFYLGLGQQAPTVAVRGDMGLVPPLARQYRGRGP